MEPAGRENASTCQSASFLTKNMMHNTFQRDSDDTNRGKGSRNSMRSKQEAENSGGGDPV